jgi:hypothetical protein
MSPRADSQSGGRWPSTGLVNELEALLREARAGGRPIALGELEELYTSGCAEILQLEAEAARLRRELRHVRTAIEWMQEQNGSRGRPQ